MSQPLKCREMKIVDPANVFTLWFPLRTGKPTFHAIRSPKTVRSELAWAGCLGSVPSVPGRKEAALCTQEGTHVEVYR